MKNKEISTCLIWNNCSRFLLGEIMGPYNVFSFFVLKNTVLLHTLATAAAQNLRMVLKLCSRVTILCIHWILLGRISNNPWMLEKLVEGTNQIKFTGLSFKIIFI